MSQQFEAIFSEYGGLLSRVASSYEANEALQQELLQEIAVAVWQALERFNGDSSVKTYLLKIAHNRAVTHVASQVKRVDTEAYPESADAFIGHHATPELTASQQQSLNTLLSAVRELPLQSRQVLTLSLEGLSYDEIADVCGLTKSHVGVILKRAKASVKQGQTHEQ